MMKNKPVQMKDEMFPLINRRDDKPWRVISQEYSDKPVTFNTNKSVKIRQDKICIIFFF